MWLQTKGHIWNLDKFHDIYMNDNGIHGWIGNADEEDFIVDLISAEETTEGLDIILDRIAEVIHTDKTYFYWSAQKTLDEVRKET